jgi:hypothetical protein
MGAKLAKSDHFGTIFCLVIGWLEEAYKGIYGEKVYVWEADEETGRLVLVGDSNLAQQFQHEAGLIIAATPDPANEWRKV